MPELHFITPDARFAHSYADALEEGLHLAPATPEDIALARTDFAEYLRHRFDLSRPVILPDGSAIPRVAQHDWWLMSGAEFLGIACLRPTLNESLSLRGGNIGYAVRKSQRRKGYGHHILRLALPKLRTYGLTQALITCHDENHGSIRIIETAGGKLQDKLKISGLEIPERRYLIDLTLTGEHT